MPLQTIQDFENQAGKQMSIWNWMQWWLDAKDQTHDPNFNFQWMDECRNAGMIPMVSWAPSTILIPGVYGGYDDIINGKFDNYLKSWGEASQQWGHPYFMRPFWEFNADWSDGKGQSPWTGGGTPEKFVAAWQHIVNTVRAAGGTQISWIWGPAQCMEPEDKLRTVYPGDNYVDWVGTDVYSTLEYAQTYLGEIRDIAPSKPVILPEIGYVPGTVSDSYWHDILTNGLPNEYSYIKGICIWEMPGVGLTVFDPSINPSFASSIASDYYISNIYSNLNISPLEALNGAPNPTSTHPTSSPFPTYGGINIDDPTATPTPIIVQNLPSGSSVNIPMVIVLTVIGAIGALAVTSFKRRR